MWFSPACLFLAFAVVLDAASLREARQLYGNSEYGAQNYKTPGRQSSLMHYKGKMAKVKEYSTLQQQADRNQKEIETLLDQLKGLLQKIKITPKKNFSSKKQPMKPMKPQNLPSTSASDESDESDEVVNISATSIAPFDSNESSASDESVEVIKKTNVGSAQPMKRKPSLTHRMTPKPTLGSAGPAVVKPVLGAAAPVETARAETGELVGSPRKHPFHKQRLLCAPRILRNDSMIPVTNTTAVENSMIPVTNTTAVENSMIPVTNTTAVEDSIVDVEPRNNGTMSASENSTDISMPPLDPPGISLTNVTTTANSTNLGVPRGQNTTMKHHIISEGVAGTNFTTQLNSSLEA